MFSLKIILQLISIYRAIIMLIFILFYAVIPNKMNSFLLITALLSDFLDGYVARKFQLATTGGKLLDLFSDKYLNCISIVFLITNHYSLLPLLIILTKEIFVLSFRSIEIDGELLIPTNRTIGGAMSGILWLCVFLHINHICFTVINKIVMILGILNLLYLFYKIIFNFSKLKDAFNS